MRKRLTVAWFLFSFIIILPFVSTKEVLAATNDNITKFAKQFEGTPYLWAGTTPAGFDCSGFIRYVFSNFGIDLPRTSETQYTAGKPVEAKDLQPGDIVFFQNTYKEGISHSGIYLGDNQFISAESKGIAISKLFSHPYWDSKYAGARRVTGNAKPTAPIFTDVTTSHLAYNAIVDLNNKGIIGGYPDATFKPEESITRGQAAAMLNRHLKLTAKQEVTFTDVGKSNPFAPHIAAMNEADILKGYENGTFGIDDTLTRGQLAVILDRAFNLQAKANKVQIASLYQDVAPNYWASDAIHALKTLDKTGIFQTSTYDITKNTSRAEFSAAVYSAISK
ncbi:C40 family peptidase [Sporosarcina sp. HYO08]|uniref:C40 family peptidase n=1 Tax=Sporosarcina sp. HYO08 TaxID=1759557 RepID=UPI00079355ED|nr:C40 family peptidase [Sporosarcina sp. HYO08]KXH84014.1 hypothetical protein AU377_04475 [Sporosarcina sp. HYO08]